MRGGADAQVGDPFPVAAVVFASVAGLCEIGDLVMFIARVAKFVHADQKLSRLLIGIGGGFLLLADLFVERCFRFHGKCIGRNMRHLKLRQCFNVLDPLRIGQAGGSIDEVCCQVGKMLQRQLKGLSGLFGIVYAVHPLEIGICKTLNAQAESVDAELFPLGE